MLYQNSINRPGLTAIAAVLTLIATSAHAQSVVPDPAVTETPPAAPVSATAPPAPASSAPAPAEAVQAVPSHAAKVSKLPDFPVVAAEPESAAHHVVRPVAKVPAAAAIRPEAQADSREGKTPLARLPAQMPHVTPAPPSLAVPTPVPPASTLQGPAQGADLLQGAQGGTSETEWLALGGGVLALAGAAVLAVTRRRKSGGARAEPVTPKTPPPQAQEAGFATAASPTSRPVDPKAGDDRRIALEKLIAEAPSAAIPFRTRVKRLRRAHYLLRTGQVQVASETKAVDSAASAQVAMARADRWSERHLAGKTQLWVSWKPAQN